MAKDELPAPLTEPVVVPCLFCSGIDIETGDGFIRIVGYVHLETVGYGTTPERRIISRVVLPADTARSLLRDLRAELSGGSN